ncbi:hypothetical protein [Microbacterium sp. bgisy203]|uniref:hypothetical protein n=1 Tax=Microbacterium sp. bgisy203 TaxID=3413799 RepID=UPI003D7362E6
MTDPTGRAPASGEPASEAGATPSDTPSTDAPSPDVVNAASSTLPGEHRGGFQRELTEPVPITATSHLEPEPDVRWAPVPEVLPHSAGWALTFGILGLIVSFLVGWGFLIGLVGAGLAVAALRRPWESRPVAIWALCLSLLSVIYSAGWLRWASTQGPLFG